MSKKDLAERFSHDVDNLLQEAGLADLPDTPQDYQSTLDLAQQLASTDFSRDSKIRHTLKHRLLNQIEQKWVSTIEIPGPWWLLGNLITRSDSKQSDLPRVTHRQRRNGIRVTIAGVIALVAVFLTAWLIEPQLKLSHFNSLSQLFFDRSEAEQLPARQLLLHWEFRGRGGIGAPPAVDSNFVYAGSNYGYVYALDTETGQEVWRFQTDSSVEVAPVVAGVIVYANSATKLYALDKFMGTLRWQFDIDVAASPAVADNSIYVPDRNGNLVAIDVQTGREQWRFKTNGPLSSSPAIAGDTIYVGSRDRHLYAIDMETGQQRWSYRTGNWVASTPTIVGDTVFFGSNDEFVYALEAATGDEKWRFKTGNDVFASPTVSGETVFVGSYDSTLYAINAKTDEEQWRFKTGRPIKSSAVVIDSIVYVGSGDGYLYGIDSETGQLIHRFEVGSQIYADPVAVEDKLFVVSGKGQLWALASSDIQPNQSQSPPPMVDNQVELSETYHFQFTPGSWYATGDDSIVYFHGQVTDKDGNPVNGFSIQIDNGLRTVVSPPSGPNRWQPTVDPGQWRIALGNPRASSGWWWLTLGRYDCPVEADYNAQCQQFSRLSESVKVEVNYPDEAVINADWICHTDCQAGVAVPIR